MRGHEVCDGEPGYDCTLCNSEAAREEIRLLRESLERIREMTFAPNQSWCGMRKCQLHTDKWGQIQAEAARALRESQVPRKDTV